jgi:competence protein ComFC
MREMQISPDSPGLIPQLINALYPAKCPSCGKKPDTFRFAPFCSACWSGIEKYTGPCCRICATPFSSESATICAECMKTPPHFVKAMSFGLFDGTLATAIHFFKFQRLKRLHRPLGDLLPDFNMAGIDAIISVPLSVRGLRERGFNQSLLLAKTLSDRTKTPLIMDGLLKITETAPQIGLSRNERRANLKDAFRADRKFPEMRLLLVDDVMTTCSTANECSKELLRAGAAEVRVLTLARANYL